MRDYIKLTRSAPVAVSGFASGRIAGGNGLLADYVGKSEIKVARAQIVAMEGGSESGVVRRADGGITGVHSLSEMQPIKIAGFHGAGNGFDGAVEYSQWVFAYQARQVSPGQQVSRVQKPNFDSAGDKPLW